MVYPRRCPLCEADCCGPIRSIPAGGPTSEFRHATLRAEPGGTPSPWRPALPGRLLTLACAVCGGEYAWDYFGGRPPPGSAAAPAQLGGSGGSRRRP
jgi:hypothetical protein